MKKICIICKQEFETRDSRSKCCKNIECKRQLGCLRYAADKKECVCKKCGRVYFATTKQNHDCCPECTKAKPHVYKKQVEQKHCCRQCKKVLFVEIKNVTKNIPEFIYDKTCDECKKRNKLIASERMTLDNPSYKNKKYNSIEEAKEAKRQRQEAKRKYKIDEDRKLASSEKMKAKNPMFNLETRQKVRATRLKLIEEGKIVYDGTKNKNYKGDRGIKNYLRLAITWWRKENFERTNYTCECCGKTHVYLQVHHLEKFSDIVEKFANELDLDLRTLVYKSADYNKLEELVVNYHKEHNIGLVVCEECHDKIDECFHKRKLLDVNENEDKRNKDKKN